MAFCGLRLMKIQIVDGSDYLNQPRNPYISKQIINATRGEIVDINSKPIVENKVAFSVVIENAFFPSDNAISNEILNKTIAILKEYGHDYIESIPITFENHIILKKIGKLMLKSLNLLLT